MTRSPSRCSCCGQCSYTATEGVLILLRGGNAALVLVCVVFIGEYRVLVASRETISISGMRRFLRARPLGIQKSENTDSRHERLSWERRRSERAREGESRCRGRPRDGGGSSRRGPAGADRPPMARYRKYGAGTDTMLDRYGCMCVSVHIAAESERKEEPPTRSSNSSVQGF